MGGEKRAKGANSVSKGLDKKGDVVAVLQLSPRRKGARGGVAWAWEAGRQAEDD